MKWTDEQISRYAAGDMDPAQAEKLEQALKRLLKSRAPEVPSKRMWENIKARIEAGEMPAEEPGFFSRLLDAISLPPSPVFRYALGGAAALMLVVVGLQVAKNTPQPELAESQPAQPVEMSDDKAAPPAVAAKREEAREAKAPAAMDFAEAPSAAAEDSAPRKMAAASARTEVERALEEQNLDTMIAALLERQRELKQAGVGSQADSSAGSGQARGMAPGATHVAFAPAPAAASAPSLSRGRSMPRMSLSSPEVFNSGTPSGPLGGPDQSGFWDFSPAARALNSRQWKAAEAEFELAQQKASEPAERAFAGSALRLLSLPGQPLQDRVEDFENASQALSVQSAGRWQYFAANRVALYSGGVVARMPGLRSEGSALQLDLNFDRASFAAGTRFIRLSGAESQVTGESGSKVTETEFMAPRGADYLLKNTELRLK